MPLSQPRKKKKTFRSRRKRWLVMRVFLCVLLLLPVSFPCYCYAWTASEWLGVVEATAGTVVLRPTKTPVGDICENCSGTGRLGDGTISVECPVCEGTGKPVQQGRVRSPQKDCPTCGSPDTIKASPTPPGMDAPAVKHDAETSGGGTYKRGLFRRR